MYCLFRYAEAPSCMADAMAFIRSVPLSSLRIYTTTELAYTSPMIPAIGAAYKNGLMLPPFSRCRVFALP
jgi:hypothetical protein